MGERTSHSPGTFSWTDLSTSDPGAAKGFYTGLFGWEIDDREIPGDGGIYTMLLRNGKEAAALTAAQEGVPPNWTAYVTVASAADSAAKAGELGGTVLAGPFDVGEAGRMAVVGDPAGAIFSVWEPRDSIGAEVVNEVGAFTMSQLNTTDPERALGFYGDLFGWRGESVEGGEVPYWGLYNGDRLNAGMMLMPPEFGAPPHWLVYFGIESVDASVDRLGELGGQVMVEPTDVPGGKILVAQDPQGAVFGLWSGGYDD